MPGRPKMSEEEKRDRQAVERYLKWMELGPDGARSRSTTSVERLQARLDKLPQLQRDAKTMISRLALIQEAIDLDTELEARKEEPMLIAGFIDAAPRFSEARKISPNAWREIGVPLTVLRAAGIIAAAAESSSEPREERTATTAANSGIQSQVLTHLREHGPFEDPEGGALNLLAESMGIGTKAVSNAVRRLVEQGYAKRELKSPRRALKLEAMPEVAA